MIMLTNESDNTNRIKKEKKIEKNTNFFCEKYIPVYQNNFNRFFPSFDQIDILPNCKNQIVVKNLMIIMKDFE